MRPRYQTKEQKDTAEQACSTFANKFKLGYFLLPESYGVNFGLTHLANNQLCGFAEVRSRNVYMDAYDTTIISLNKIKRGLYLSNIADANLPFVLVIVWKDKIGYIDVRKAKYEVLVGGRFDRGDPKDREELAHFQVCDFKVLKEDRAESGSEVLTGTASNPV